MDMVYTRAVTIGAVVNIIINCVLIYFIGARGASIATVISYAVILVIQILPLTKELKGAVKYVAFPLAAGLVMYGSVRLSSLITGRLFWSVCIELVVGVIVYGGLSLLYLCKKQPRIIKAILNK
jgi:O-antigen/teichoic acid export membrane protein